MFGALGLGLEAFGDHEVEARGVLAQLDCGLILGRRVAVLRGLVAGELDDERAAVGDALRWQAQPLSLRRAAAVLLAATRQRLETGTIPTTISDLTAKPAPPTSDDPFAAGEPLRMKQAENELLVYSVGPDGEDDGGPVTPSADADTNTVEENDDVGLRMAL